MVESLVITLREGIEAALVVGIILAYLTKTGRNALKPFVYWGLGLAILGSLGAAVAMQSLNIDPENEYLEGALLGVAGLFVGSMVIWMWSTAKDIRGEMEGRLAPLVGDSSSAVKSSAWGLMLFTFFMVFREGIETVLFFYAVTFGEADLMSLAGGAVGLTLATLFAVFLVRGSLKINLGRFFSVTSAILLVLAVKLLAGSVHEFAEVGVLPMSPEVMRLLGYFVRDNTSMLILMALLLLPVLLILWDAGGKRNGRRLEATEAGEDASARNTFRSSAERRKQLASSQREKVWRTAIVASAVLIIFTMGSTVFAGNKFVDPTPIPVEATGNQVQISLADLTEGNLYKYVYDAAGVKVRFIVVKQEDGTVSVGLDACDVCGTAGYMQEERHAICKNCNAPIFMPTVGEGGGCNPMQLKAQVTESQVNIPVNALDAAAIKFKG